MLGELKPVRSVTFLEMKLVQKEERSQSDAEGTEEAYQGCVNRLFLNLCLKGRRLCQM